MRSFNFFKIILLFKNSLFITSLFLLTSLEGATNNYRDFTSTFKNNLNGNVIAIGNSIMLAPGGNGGICPDPAKNNSDINMVFANKDADNSTVNSTMAKLILPPSVNSNNIKYAGLYWQGRFINTNNSSMPNNAKQVLFKAYGEMTYKVVTSINSKFNYGFNTAPGFGPYNDYQGVADITQDIKNSINKVATNTIQTQGFNQEMWVANIQASNENNGFGAWSIIVIYENLSDSLKNIVLYDGFKTTVKGQTIAIPLSGFLTPTAGPVNAKFIIFGGEGDIGRADTVTLRNNAFPRVDVSLGNNVFDSTIENNGINNADRNPYCSNTIGIDLDSFNIGTTGNPKIISNGQSDTIIKITEPNNDTWDQIFPGAFAFSTDIYQPFITIDKSTNTNGQLTPKQLITYTANIKNTGNENAENIVIYDNFRDNNISRTDGTLTNPLVTLEDLLDHNVTEIKNSITCVYGPSNTNCKNACTVTINPLKVSCTIPILNINQTASVQFQARMATNPDTKGQSLNVENKMYATYSNALTHIVIVEPAQSNTASAGEYSPISNSSFDAWESSLSNSNPKLYTKAIGNTINFNLGKIDGANFTGSVCAQLIGGNLTSAYQCLTYNNVSSQTFSWNNIAIADPNVYVHIKNTLLQNQTNPDATWSDSNSTDRFAIRPDHFEFNPIAFKLKAGEDYNLTVHARPQTGTTDVVGYNQSKDSLSLSVDKRMPAPHSIDINNTLNGVLTFAANNFSFINGITSTMGITYNDVGIITIKLDDTNWTSVDASDDALNPIINRTIHGETNVTVIPFDFNVSNVIIRDHNGSNFTYLSNDINMSAEVSMTITACNKQKATTLNYSDNLFEQNISITPTIKHGLLDANETNSTNQNLAFVNGVSTISWDNNNSVKFNFDRNSLSSPINPFDVNGSDVNITVRDTDFVRGDANQTATGVATFYYGRVHAPDYIFAGDTGTATVYYEVYCKDCNQTFKQSMDINGSESPDAINWYRNTSHINRDGNVTTFRSVGIASINGYSNDNEHSGAITTGSETKIIFSATIPYVDSITMTPSSWLTFPTGTPPSFTVKFSGAGQWAGQGSLGRTIDDTNTSVSRKSNKRIEW